MLMLALVAVPAIAMNTSDQIPATFLAPGSSMTRIADGLQFTEGPCELTDGSLVFSDIPANRMYRLYEGKLAVYRDPSHNANGQTLDREGRLLTCEHGSRRVTRAEKDGTTTVLAEKFEGKRLNSPNDITVAKDGTIFFTDPPYGIDPKQAEMPFNGVYAIRDGHLFLLDRTFDRPNGLVLSPDEKYLYVADTAKNHIRRFHLGPSPLSPSEKGGGALGEGRGPRLEGGEVWASTPNPDGLRVDSEGRVWSASNDGVNVISPEGKVLEVIKVPEVPANLCFSRDGKTLYATARTGVYRVAVRVKGIAP